MKSLLTISMLFLVGCGAAPKTPLRPPFGYAFTYYKAPLTTHFGDSQGEPTRTDFQKYGVSQTKYVHVPFIGGDILRFGWGDAGLDDAAKNGGLSNIYYADYETLSVLGVYSTYTTYAYGE